MTTFPRTWPHSAGRPEDRVAQYIEVVRAPPAGASAATGLAGEVVGPAEDPPSHALRPAHRPENLDRCTDPYEAGRDDPAVQRQLVGKASANPSEDVEVLHTGVRIDRGDDAT